MELTGRNAIVTGGAHRVGKAITLALAGAGCNVYIHYGRSDAAARETAAEVAELGVTAAIGSADLGDTDALAGVVAAATGELGPVSVLVNSASGFATDTVRTVDPEGWRRTMSVTLKAPVFLTRAFAAALGGGEGAVVNVTDWRTARPYADHLTYHLAKAGLDAFTEAAAVQLAPTIRVNAVALGAILPPPGEGSEYLKQLAGGLPLQRTGNPGLVADAVLYLLRSDFTTGEILRIAGGAHLV